MVPAHFGRACVAFWVVSKVTVEPVRAAIPKYRWVFGLCYHHDYIAIQEAFVKKIQRSKFCRPWLAEYMLLRNTLVNSDF